MAFPEIQATATSSETSGTTSHTVSLPTGIISGEILLCFFSAFINRTGSFPAGWNTLAAAGTLPSWTVAYKVADGTEGSSITVTTSSNEMSLHRTYRIDAADSVVSSSIVSGGGSMPDSPSLDAGAAGDNLWLSAFTTHLPSTVVSWPTNYTYQQDEGSGADMLTAVAARQLNAGTEDPGPFTKSLTGTPHSITIAIGPAAGMVEATATGVATVAAITKRFRTLPAAAAPAAVIDRRLLLGRTHAATALADATVVSFKTISKVITASATGVAITIKGWLVSAVAIGVGTTTVTNINKVIKATASVVGRFRFTAFFDKVGKPTAFRDKQE